jgi:hypothetical protein
MNVSDLAAQIAVKLIHSGAVELPRGGTGRNFNGVDRVTALIRDAIDEYLKAEEPD